MSSLHRGRIRSGAIELSEPVALPEGTEVVVNIEPLESNKRDHVRAAADPGAVLPLIGIWADREDMRDSSAWVRKEREAWQQRLERQD